MGRSLPKIFSFRYGQSEASLKNSEQGSEITGCDMEKIVFFMCVMAVTVYLTVAAWEDHKSCEVTRWKHLIGGIPAIFLFLWNLNSHSWEENVMILAFSTLYIVLGYAGAYGFADGLVLANLSVFFGSIGGIYGSGMVLVIMILAAFSFLLCHLGKCVVEHKKVSGNITGALVPHILVGYLIVALVMLRYIW